MRKMLSILLVLILAACFLAANSGTGSPVAATVTPAVIQAVMPGPIMPGYPKDLHPNQPEELILGNLGLETLVVTAPEGVGLTYEVYSGSVDQVGVGTNTLRITRSSADTARIGIQTTSSVEVQVYFQFLP